MTGENPKEKFARLKPPLRYVPPALALFASRVFELGARKYGPMNWRKQPASRLTYIEAIERHLYALKDGQDIDPESGQPHEAHIAACCAILLDAAAHGSLIEDRFDSGPAPAIIDSLTESMPQKSE